ncbi:MAG: hypothetical protein EA424_27265 [Planctomycetaceae bacterium]|nr:MAG: hypothetical protein EA424_27265 [Planctomycetaceae bacterium]
MPDRLREHRSDQQRRIEDSRFSLVKVPINCPASLLRVAFLPVCPEDLDTTLATESPPVPAHPTDSPALTALVQFIDAKMARTFPGLFVPDEFAHDPKLATLRKLRSALKPLSFPDEEGRCAYIWPSSHLTDRDMSRLNVWGRLTGLPSNQLLHLSVTVMSEWLRLHLVQVLAKHEENGIPFEVLIGGTPANARRKRGRAHQSAAGQTDDAATPAVSQAPLIVLPSDLPVANPPTTTSPPPMPSTIDAPHPEASACAAEPPPTAGSRSPPGPPAPACHVASRSARGHPPSEELLDQLRQTCDEIRVLWQAVDELRESFEHALRNPPESDEPRRALSDPVVELDVDDLLERLQQLPPALLANLQGQLATMDQPPPEPPPAAEPSPRQPIRPAMPSSPPKPEDNGRSGKKFDAPAPGYRRQQRLF